MTKRKLRLLCVTSGGGIRKRSLKVQVVRL